eukprot:TRINITY_DN17578_c0_g1_i2.p1 TRINITY_DN17578_c0_g1~~TRINITY_DN17578_c0_g1_i2.p1  ORF type:complete len:331 (+),score=74.33 TRINITY_DN17578_c0_g1_i2:60-995(+)
MCIRDSFNTLQTRHGEHRIAMKGPFARDCKAKVLHYFEPKSRNLFLLDLDSVSKDGAHLRHGGWVRISLDINFNFEEGFRSQVSPDGEIFITAPSHERRKGFFSVNFLGNTLTEEFPMKVAREHHCIVWADDGLFVVGGTDPNTGKALADCERYDFDEEDWKPIASVNVAASKAAMCSVGRSFLFKFGGLDSWGLPARTIECYDIRRNEWSIVRATAEADVLELCHDSMAAQISPDEILVFGGRSAEGFLLETGYIFFLPRLEDFNYTFGASDLVLKVIQTFLRFAGAYVPNSHIVHENALLLARSGYYEV